MMKVFKYIMNDLGLKPLIVTKTNWLTFKTMIATLLKEKKMPNHNKNHVIGLFPHMVSIKSLSLYPTFSLFY